MSSVESKIKTAERPSKRKHLSEEDTFYLKEVEVENFLQILSRVSHSEEELEELETSEGSGIDRKDGTLDIIILAASKLHELLKGDIDALKLPQILKKSLKLLKAFIKFIKSKKILETFNNTPNEKTTIGEETTESSEVSSTSSKSD